MASTASTGPAGAHFEGQVGASYLLAMLVGAEPRGLPGTSTDRIAFQRAAEGHPLDDVIVHAHDALGKVATLEVQVKKGMTFAPGDKIFREVVGQIVQASRKPEFLTSRYELGIAISRTSHNIDGAYKDVLTWARQIGDSATFIHRINRRGSANDRMRSFVETFRAHLEDAGAAHDDNTVWLLLRRMQILVFDFTPSGSASEELAKERAARALHPEDISRAGNLWNELIELSIEIAKAGGDRNRSELKTELAQKNFRLAGDRKNQSALAALAEASSNALGDIDDRIGGVVLTRHERVAAVHDALDQGRYVEIRGDAGVGKSAVLKHFAEQVSTEARIIALSPNRTIAKGWTVMQSVLRFDGTAHELLSDLAANGGGILSVDSLEFFGEEERLTVIDLVRESAKVPGISVIATARREFGVAEPNWLPSDALDALGRADPVIIGELSDGETEELRNAAPQLTALLSDSHPARAVARNLFRLSRLANQASDAPMPRTEVEMAEQWWQSADGKKDAGHRERSRVLATLAEQALSRVEQVSVRGLPAAAVDALVESETLRDLGNERVIFRHDVLREWAIANLLFADPALTARLPLARPAPADLARGVELAARLAVERTVNGDAWHQFLTGLSTQGVNDSWRRAVLLALVRSELGGEMLTKASTYLLADRGKLLGELIRIVMAVDSEPATKYYGRMGLAPQSIPAGINVPSGPTWLRLIIWLLKLGFEVPARVIPDVVALYTNWSVALGGKDPWTPRIVRWFYQWLTEITKASDGEAPRQPFNGQLNSGLGKLAEELRTGFLLFCNHAPELAVDYLESLKNHPYADRAREETLKFRGALAQAAPKELAQLTAEVLMKEGDEDRYSRFQRPFGHADLIFVPASPAQGPFFELLVHAPEHGLPLIRKLVDHVILFYAGEHDFGADAMTVVFSDGSKVVFPWHKSYNWSREVGGGPATLASALMALEEWSHRRVEAGEPIEKVIADVIGPPNPPAAYLLVIVDLLLSHWPKSRVVAVPFLGCPELLCLDLHRTGTENIQALDILGLGQLQKEPIGLASKSSLKARPSLRFTLDQLLPNYAREGFEQERAKLAELLHLASERLGPPKPQSNLGDPDFMVLHALNRINPENWRETTVHGDDGRKDPWEYVSPAAESEHLKPLQDASRKRQANGYMQRVIGFVLNNPKDSSLDFAAAAVKWAQEIEDKPSGNETEEWMREEAILSGAAIAARDGGPDLVARNAEWIRKTFGKALKGKNDPAHRTRAGLQFNPIAIAFVGTAHLVRNRFAMQDVRILLEAAGDDNPAAAQGFVEVVSTLASIDERIPRAILRCAFAACVRPHRHWRVSEEGYAAHVAIRRKQVESAIAAELAWLNGERDEPGWPPFARQPAYPRHRSGRRQERREHDGNTTPDLYTDHQAAALWLGKAVPIFDVVKRPWLRDIVEAYSDWTSVANGSELEDEDADRTPLEWNYAYFNLLAYCLPGWTMAQIDETALGLILGLPEEAYLDAMAMFQRSVDGVYFSDFGLQQAEAVHIRSMLARKLMETRDWKWHSRDRSTSIGTRLGPAIAVIFFNDYGTFVAAKCYLLEKGIDGLGPFLPVLSEVVRLGTFLFVAMILLNLLEVSPRPEHLPLIVLAGKLWSVALPDDKEFWVEQAIGRRLCSVIEAILVRDRKVLGNNETVRTEIESLLPGLIRLGVAEAYRLEDALREIP
ncbi:MAG TPA: hypothetical protein VHU83_04225 [Bryobacteraceae bacterium]|nr:hypothetical protein [Bryobacteraceae bacterium]